MSNIVSTPSLISQESSQKFSKQIHDLDSKTQTVDIINVRDSGKSSKTDNNHTDNQRHQSEQPDPPQRNSDYDYKSDGDRHQYDNEDENNQYENEVPLVDMETFGQLLEMDDDEEHSFSKSLTYDYFDQAVTTFSEMDVAVSNGDLITLSRKGHFLKGSSAALGLNQVKASCEKMQHYGNKKKSNGEGTLTEAEAMEKCKALLEKLKNEQKHSKAWLERFYEERST